MKPLYVSLKVFDYALRYNLLKYERGTYWIYGQEVRPGLINYRGNHEEIS